MELAYKMSSPADFFRPIPRIEALFGGTFNEKSNFYQNASPIRFVNSGSVPTLLFHGEGDFWVWNGHSHRLNDKLHSVGVKSVFIEFPWANHGFDVNLNGPSGQISTEATLWFLKANT